MTIYCHWSGKPHTSCERKPVCEMQSLLGSWSPICKYHLEQKKRNNQNNMWGGLFPIVTRELSTPLKEK